MGVGEAVCAAGAQTSAIAAIAPSMQDFRQRNINTSPKKGEPTLPCEVEPQRDQCR
jgi:hypothetical protein